MIRNYYTLIHIVNELNSLTGKVVTECFSQDKDSLVIGLEDATSESFIFFVCDGKYDSIHIRKSFSRAKKNSFTLLKDLEGEVFQSASLVGKSRIIQLNFLYSSCYVVLFGGVNSNFFLMNSDSVIIDCFKNHKEHIGKNVVNYSEHHKQFNEFPPETTIKYALANSDYLFGSVYTNEILSRINSISPNKILGELNPEELSNIGLESFKLKQELVKSNEFYLLEDDNNRKIMSPVKLIGYEVRSIHKSCSEAIARKQISDTVETEFRTEFKKIENYLTKQQHKINKQIENMSDIESAIKREAEYRKFAELLISYQDNKSKYGDKIIISDWDGTEYEIKLDPKLKLVDNAKKYFDKARATIEDIKIRKIRIPEMIEKLNSVNEKLTELRNVTQIKELSRFETGIKQVTGQRVNTSKMTMEEKFRKFELGDGYILYAGKNAANNDELTMKFAKPNDVWLHARGSSGSHTIIKMDAEEKPPKAILQKAAEITAYYSGARNAKYVPVIWTYKKYVRKPKGANVGAVVVAKETVIMAEPKLPEN